MIRTTKTLHCSHCGKRFDDAQIPEEMFPDPAKMDEFLRKHAGIIGWMLITNRGGLGPGIVEDLCPRCWKELDAQHRKKEEATWATSLETGCPSLRYFRVWDPVTHLSDRILIAQGSNPCKACPHRETHSKCLGKENPEQYGDRMMIVEAPHGA